MADRETQGVAFTASSVTEADIESHHILAEGLSKLPGNLPKA